MAKLPFKEKGNTFLVDAYAIEALVPTIYEDRGMYMVISDKVAVYGVFNVNVYLTKGAHDSKKPSYMFPIVIGNKFISKPTEKKMADIQIGATIGRYVVLTYFSGDIFIEDKNVISDSANVSAIYSLFDDGKIDYLPYEVILQMLDSYIFKDNHQPPSAPLETIHAIAADKYRDPRDISTPVRLLKKIPENIIPVNPREAVTTGSTMSMVSFEDMNTALLVAHNKAKRGDIGPMTPIEKVINGVID